MNGAADNAGTGKASFRFPHQKRLLQHAAFEKVYGSGGRIFQPDITVFYRRRDGAESDAGARVGFTVSRAMGGAVARNRIRRRLREAVRLNLASLSGQVDVVINAKRTVLKADFPRLAGEVERAFVQISRGSGRNAEGAKDAKERKV